MGKQNKGQALCALAASLGVAIGEACDRAGVDRTTLARWRRGGRPRPDLVTLVRLSIEQIAAERGTLPSGQVENRDALALELREIRKRLDRIEEALAIRPPR